MFEQKAVMFLYGISPIHPGSGTSLGVVDNPIQRERHTGHPIIAGSGLKGAMRHQAVRMNWDEKKAVEPVFGPGTQSNNSHAGAVSFSDAQIVLFPVRSLKNTFAYTLSPTTLARLKRLLIIAGIDAAAGWTVPSLNRNQCIVTDNSILNQNQLVLESFSFTVANDQNDNLKNISKWLSEHVFPDKPEFQFFKDKLQKDLVLIHDDRFNFFAKNSTIVEPHVRISDESGTAEEGGLFYTENIPPESVMVSLVHASKEWIADDKDNGKNGQRKSASEILQMVTKDVSENGFNDSLLQIGGDATTGRGQVLIRFVANEYKEEEDA